MSTPGPEVQLEIERALGDFFSELELRQLIRRAAPDLVREVGEGLSVAALAAEVVLLLVRHGRLDATFFGAWASVRGARRAEIRALAARAGVDLLEVERVESNASAPQLPDARPTDPRCLDAIPQLGGCALWLGLARWCWMRSSAWGILVVVGAFLVCVLLPSKFARDRVIAVAMLLVGAGLCVGGVYGICTESRRSDPQPA